MFDFDWFHRGGLAGLKQEAKRRCALKKYPLEAGQNGEDETRRADFMSDLYTRVIIYMKDGLTYEVRDITDLGQTQALAFECVPVDDSYKAGAIVIVTPYDDIARVEVFAVHPDEKPEEILRIPGFRTASADGARDRD